MLNEATEHEAEAEAEAEAGSSRPRPRPQGVEAEATSSRPRPVIFFISVVGSVSLAWLTATTSSKPH
jgi:hypothetical protein